MPLDQGQIEEAAAFLFHLHVQRQTAAALPFEIAPKDLDDAYAIQDAVHAAAGWPIGVLKVGCTSEIAQQMLAIPHPIGGRVPSASVFTSGDDVPVSLFNAAPLIECELAMQVDAAGRVVAVAPAIELINPRVQASGGFGGFTTVADNSAAAAVVLGAPVSIVHASELDVVSDAAVRLRSDGEIVAEGRTSAVIGGPASSVAWTQAHEAARNRSIPDPTWIITGTCTGLTPSVFGATYTAAFDGIGEVSYSISG